MRQRTKPKRRPPLPVRRALLGALAALVLAAPAKAAAKAEGKAEKA